MADQLDLSRPMRLLTGRATRGSLWLGHRLQSAMKHLLILCWLALASTLVADRAMGSESLVDEPDGDTYNFVSHYAVKIEAPAARVWAHLIELGSWMYDFEMKPVAGFNALEGKVLQLYEGQQFYVQITKAIPQRLLVIANLPTSMEGEQLTSGISVTMLTEHEGTTTVDLTMSRRYSWPQPGENHLKKRRQSDAFIANTRATWARFLSRLSTLSTTGSSAAARQQGD